jgi:hypothetical protein
VPHEILPRDNRKAGANEMSETVERAELGIDGNCGFARLGPNLQEGEAEFEPIEVIGARNLEKLAINRAFTRLKTRLGGVYLGKPISYYIGPSHPDYL